MNQPETGRSSLPHSYRFPEGGDLYRPFAEKIGRWLTTVGTIYAAAVLAVMVWGFAKLVGFMIYLANVSGSAGSQ
jgi:hypothetical protein